MAEKEIEKAEEKKEIKKSDWIKIKPAELEKIVVDLYKQGESAAKIGLVLRDKYGVPKAKLLGKRITKILQDAKVSLRSKKDIVTKRMDSLNKHIASNKHDQPARKQLVKQLWALKGIEKAASQ
jgi:small subunit ribosomal protein S15